MKPTIVRSLLTTLVFTLTALSAGAAGVDFSKLPLPSGTKPVYVDSNQAIYAINAPVANTAEALAKLLLAQGWQPYGSSGETRYYKRGTTRLLATVQAEGGQGVRTMISFQSESMSADLPLIPDAEEVQYVDSSKQLGFLASLSPEGVADYYRKALAPAGWSTNMEKPDLSDFKYVIIFRSQKNEEIRIEMTPTDNKTRSTLTYSTAEEVQAEKQRAAAQLARLKEKFAKEASEPKPKVTLTLPSSTSSKALTKQNLRFNLTAGKAKAAVETLRDGLLTKGWKVTSAALEPIGGTLSLEQDGAALTITYMDPGFMPAEVTVTPNGVEIELSGGATNK